MSEEENQVEETRETREQELSKRLDSIGWALFFIMIGGIALIPDRSVPEGAWLIGVGLIMLGVNFARRFHGLNMIGFTLFLGIVALIFGLSDFSGLDLPLLPVLIILVGIHIILKPYYSKMRRESCCD